MATQNPVEQEGTYPLPEAQLDRFMLHVEVPYPAEDIELEAEPDEIVYAWLANDVPQPENRPEYLKLNDMINAGVRRAYLHPDNKLRASMVSPPIGARMNTGDNTPAVIHMELVPGDTLDVRVAAKGGGSS